MTEISEHISFSEATRTGTGLENNPNTDEIASMVAVAVNCFEPLRKWYGKPIHVNSFFRSEKVNKAVNGKPNSQHRKGEAIDFSAGSKEENKKLYDWCKANLIFDQLIWENDGAWIHISFKKGHNRNQSFNATQIIPK